MNVAYMEQFLKEATEKKLDSHAKLMLLCADIVGENTVFVHNPEFDSSADAVGFAQQLSLAGINELYVSSSWSNQMDNWMAMDSFGLKLRGIENIKNPVHERNGWAPEFVPAFRFSFKD